mgnify:CR=1 FL=1
MAKKVLGLDEAGRGPVVGPMVLGGAMFYEKDVHLLKKMGVKDSKLLTPKKREELFKEIKKLVRGHSIVEVSPQEIDQRFSVGSNLNKLEAIKYSEIINELRPDKVIIDAPSSNPKGFEIYLKQFLDYKPAIICENYADLNYVEVGAASILAKVIRDKRIREIEEKVKTPVGVGYPHDKRTLKFVEKALNKKEWLRNYVRKSWFTFQRIKTENEQKKLGEF